MHRENIEAHIFHPDLEEKKEMGENYSERLLKMAEELLISQKNKIGQGQTAEIHFVDINERHCLKIISRHEHYGTVILSREGLPLQKFHSLPVEAQFLDELQGLDGDVRVPKPYYTVVREATDEDDKTLEKSELGILCMERLNAVSIRNILEDGVDIPEKFDIENFFEKLICFLDKMHLKGIHHRDLHEGNIMVNIETGNPFVIDFGCAAYGNEDNGVYTEESLRKLIRYPKDMDSLDNVKAKLAKYINNLTNNK